MRTKINLILTKDDIRRFCDFDNKKAIETLQMLSQQKQSAKGSTVAEAAGYSKQWLWPVGSTIKIYFMEPCPRTISWDWAYVSNKLMRPETDFDPLYSKLYNKVDDPQQIIYTIIKERIAPLVHLKFEFTNNINESDIRILFKEESQRAVGLAHFPFEVMKMNKNNERSKPTMWFLRDSIDIGVILHEFGHQLGMIHEHGQPNTPWNPELEQKCPKFVLIQRKEQWFKFDGYELTSQKYDPKSIMHYVMDGKIKCNGEIVKVFEDGQNIPRNFKLSEDDIAWLKESYPGGGMEIGFLQFRPPVALWRRLTVYLVYVLSFAVAILLVRRSLWLLALFILQLYLYHNEVKFFILDDKAPLASNEALDIPVSDTELQAMRKQENDESVQMVLRKQKRNQFQMIIWMILMTMLVVVSFMAPEIF